MAEAHPGGYAAAHLLRDFVNTLDVESGADGFGTPAALTGWLAERGLAPAGARAREHDLTTAIALREGLRAAMRAHHGTPPGSGGDDPGGAEHAAEVDRARKTERALADALAVLPLRVAFDGPRPTLVPLGTAATEAGAGVARLAAAVVEAAADGTWSRLKVCQEGTCLWAFLDTSKNRSRAWCSMSVCGNRTKTRAYRARRRTPGPR